MQKVQILELEKDFKAYKIRLWLKRCAWAVAFCVCSGSAFAAFIAHKDKQDTLKIALDEKNKMQEKLEIAKIEAQKAQILSQKRQNLATQSTAPKPAVKPKEKIIIHSYVANVEKLEQEFAQSTDYKKALQIANLHFADKNYEKALQWSFKANELDKTDAGAWITFAKAKFALGKKDEAKRALQSFLRYYNADINALDEVKYILQ